MKKFTLKYFTQTLFFLLLGMQICFAQWMRTSEPFSNWIYAFTANGSNLFFGMDRVYLSTDNGTNWSVVNSGLPTTNLSIISFGVSPDGANLFAGTMNNGVFLSTNNGTRWTAVNSGLPENGWVSDFAVSSDNNDSTNLFVGINSAIFLSTNNGTSWTSLSQGVPFLRCMAIVPNGTGETNLFAGGTYGAGLYRFTEKDTGWSVEQVILNNSVFSLAVIDTNLFASTYDGVYLSTDDGTNWTMVNPYLESIDAFSVGSNGTNFLVGVGAGGVFVSRNNGSTWTDINEGFPSNISVYKFAVNDTYIFAATDKGVWRRPLTEIITSVYIPDTAFLYALIDEGVDSNRDSLISYAEAMAVTSLNVSGENWDNKGNISDLTGLEAFINLDSLDCSLNEINNLDISNNIALTKLWCSDNQLTNLNVSSNNALIELICGGNQLTSLDVSSNTALERLVCIGNHLTSLDVSGCTNLKHLMCGIPFGGGNQLTSLDVTNNIALTELWCDYNQLTTLDVSNNTALTNLYCAGNLLTSLDISNCGALIELVCYHNLITSLDVSNCAALTELVCTGNNLSKLNVSINTALEHLYIDENPNLSEVCVWTTPFPPEGIYVDTTRSPNVYFSTECSGTTGLKPDSPETTFYLKQNYPNPFNSTTTIKYSVLKSSNVSLKVFDILGKEFDILVNEEKPIGTYEVTWHAGNLLDGIYFYQLNTGGLIETKKMILRR